MTLKFPPPRRGRVRVEVQNMHCYQPVIYFPLPFIPSLDGRGKIAVGRGDFEKLLCTIQFAIFASQLKADYFLCIN